MSSGGGAYPLSWEGQGQPATNGLPTMSSGGGWNPLSWQRKPDSGS